METWHTDSSSAQPTPRRRGAVGVAIFAALLGGRPEAGATVIVTYRTPTEVWIAADSKIVDPRQTAADIRSCKIVQVADRVAVGMAGLEFNAYQGNVFYPEVLIRRVFPLSSDSGSLADAASLSEGILYEPLATVFKSDPLFSITPPGRSLFTMSMVGFRDVAAVAEAHIRDFQIAIPGVAIVATDCPPACGPAWQTIGKTEAVDDYLARHPGYAKRAEAVPGVGLRQAIGKLIRIAIKNAPDMCGPPVAIVRITGDGVDWKRDRLKCAKQ